MRRPPDDAVAAVLRDHFQTEETDAGLRSLDLSAVGGNGTPSRGTLSDRRLDRLGDRQDGHRRARQALAVIGRDLAEVLALAHGTTLRERDAGEGRRAAAREERNWRVRLREIYGCAESAIVVASPKAQELYAEHGAGSTFLAYLLGQGQEHREAIWEDALALLERARKAFAAAYEPAKGPRLDAPPGRRSGKRDMSRARALASSLGNGHKIRS